MRWIGQDGHDYCCGHNRLEPSDVQDVHVVLGGLDPDRDVEFIDVTTDDQKDQWQYNAQSFAWKAELKRTKGSRTADLFLEPGRIEAARNYHILIRYQGGATQEAEVRGRKVNHSLRMPGAAVQAKWVGQDRQDRVGPGPSVGPDGLQDARIRLAGVSTKVPIKAMRVSGPSGAKWESGTNPELLPNAEYWPDPKKPGEGDLFFQPDRDLKGQKLKVLVLYTNDTLDSTTLVAGRTEARLKMPESALPKITELSVTAQWLGQDGQDATGPGDVHVRLTMNGRVPAAAIAVLTDSVRGTWVYRGSDRVKFPLPSADLTGPLAVRAGSDGTSIDLFFAPYRNENKATFTLRWIAPDGRMSIARFPGGACDPGLRAPRPAEGRVEAKPGDDLNALGSRGGTVSLAAGTYRLNQPLVLDRPVTISGDGKATLLFSQSPGAPAWTAAIKIHSGHTTLDGFAVRFEGPIRWDQEVSYGPAVIGTTDSRDQGHNDLKVNVVLTRLDLEIPPAADPTKWVEAIRLVRLTNAKSGMIAGNILRGGTIEFFDGPWQLVNNDFRGTPPGTYSHGVFAGHGTHDLVIRGNRAKPVAPDGKTWRFLVLTHRSTSDLIEDNVIEGLGALDGDTIPWSNEPEIILTEAYHLSYEGRVVGLSADGRLLRVHPLQGEEPATGDVVALLSGPAAGQFRRISQVIDPVTYLVDAPIPKGTETVSVGRGFVGETFRGNRIDIRGGSKSDAMVLAGNHYGTRVIKNHLLGGAYALRFVACPSESPVTWGWSHVPMLGAVIEENIFEDAATGTIIGVDHSVQYIKSVKGRTYMAIALNRNVIRWSDEFLKRHASAQAKSPPPGLTLGYQPSHDPGELVIQAAGNLLEAPPGVKPPVGLIIHAANYNSRPIVNRKFDLPTDADSSTEAGRVPASGSGLGRPRR